MSSLTARTLLLVLVVALPATARSAAANGPAGALTQLGGPAGCIHDVDAAADEEEFPPDLARVCARGIALDGGYDVAVSPEGRHVYVASQNSASVAAFLRAPDGSLRQLPGEAACVAEGGELPCAQGVALQGPSAIAITPDGHHAYVTASYSNSVVLLTRDGVSGRVTQPAGAVGCIGQELSESDCASGLALVGAADVAVSPDGRHVYVAAFVSNGVAIFARNGTTGRLAQLSGANGCVTEKPEVDPEDPPDVPDPTAICGDAVGLGGAGGVAVSPDGRHVYVAAYGASALAVFRRDRATGRLEQLAGDAACLSGSPDEPACSPARGLDGPFSVVVSNDGRNVYAAGGFSPAHGDTDGDGGVAAFRRDPVSGRLTQLAGRAGCVSATGTDDECARARGLRGVQSLAISPDGANVYVVATADGAIAAFARDLVTGGLTQLPGRAGCSSEAGGGCSDGLGLVDISSVAVSPDGSSAYATSPATHTLAVFARKRPAAEPVRLRSRLLPVPRGLTASGSVELTLQPAIRRLCWRLAQQGAGRAPRARLRLAGTAQVVTPLGRGFARRGCTTIAARWVDRLVARPSAFVVDVTSAAYPNGALRGRLAKRKA